MVEKRRIDMKIFHCIGNGGRNATISPNIETGILEWFNIEKPFLREGMTNNRVVVKLRELQPSFKRVSRKSFCRCL
jgi:hypothetical protein